MSQQEVSGGRILVVDDEVNIGFVIQAMLERAGYETEVYTNSDQAVEAIRNGTVSDRYDAVITDLYMPGPGGMEILELCRRERPRMPVVIATAFGTVETAVSALKQGAFDFITKPFEQTELLNVVEKAVSTHSRRRLELTPSSSGAQEISTMVGGSPAMREIFRLISKVADSPSTVLITGESGTGKELVAMELHRLSRRARKPFIKINCAAIPATLIESELFGYEKGAFTGAVTSKPGRFELADGGTIFLDEVGEMPLEMQVKLLRVLQEQEFERVGGLSTRKVDVRIITATNRNLEDEVGRGTFRQDLYYRLNVVPLALPPLRDRREDIDPLLRYFLAHFNSKLRRNVQSVDPDCFAALRAYSWPGNIRQLENTVERMLLMCESDALRLSDLPPEIARELSADGDAGEALPSTGTFKEIVRRQTQTVERELIERALEDTEGNVTRAAERLGLSRKGLQLKMKELGLSRERERGD